MHFHDPQFGDMDVFIRVLGSLATVSTSALDALRLTLNPDAFQAMWPRMYAQQSTDKVPELSSQVKIAGPQRCR